ncbi:MAG: beta-galactosidase [Candidatus Pacebacteria bacterium]|nr:beta-galactosidase [Candidatus Paceibacterota bacterium]
MAAAVKYILIALIIFAIAFVAWFFIGTPKKAEKMVWGVNFSMKQTDFLGLDPKEVYLAYLDDLKAKNIKISVHWDLIEPEQGVYDFSDLDWQMKEAEKRNVDIILAIGMRTPRWPECHLPQWSLGMDKASQQKEIMSMLETVVNRYKDSAVLSAWQVENETFLKFGACPWADEKFLRQEVAFVKQLDQKKHPIITTDSGEMSFWFKTASIGDIVGFTTYRNVWQTQLKFYFSYEPFYTPVFYYKRAELINALFNKKAIGVELQAEPWCPNSVASTSIEDQQKTMSLQQLKKNINFAERTGISTYYLWGGEWWYWMKTKQNHLEYWDEMKNIFAN